jgi:hypothetical protein
MSPFQPLPCNAALLKAWDQGEKAVKELIPLVHAEGHPSAGVAVWPPE